MAVSSFLLQGWSGSLLQEINIQIPLVDRQDLAFGSCSVFQWLFENVEVFVLNANKTNFPFETDTWMSLQPLWAQGGTFSKQEISLYVPFLCSNLTCSKILLKTKSTAVLKLLEKEEAPQSTDLWALFSGISVVSLLFPFMLPSKNCDELLLWVAGCL